MAQEKRTFVGGMDFDTENRYVKQGDYRIATNMKPSGENDAVGVLENIVGSEFIDHTNDIQWSGTTLQKNGTFSFPATGAKVIGKYRDEVHDRVIYFVKEDSSGNGSILEYSQKQNAISVIVDSFAFSFGTYDFITGVNVVAHNEPWAPDGLLYFTDNKNEPRKINISKAKLISGVDSATISSGKYYSAHHEYGIDTTIESATGYGTLTEQIIKVVKYPPTYSPNVIFGTDTSVKTNNLLNNQFQFKYRYVYDDKEKSAWSPISETRSCGTATTTGSSEITDDNYLEVEFNSGTKEVRRIEIAARKVNFNTDFFLIADLDTNFYSTPSQLEDEVHSSSSDTGVPSISAISTVDTNFYFRFFNDKAYSNLDLKNSIKPFDNIPIKAKSQEIIDGNRLVYGNVVDGKNGVETNVSTDLFYKDYSSATAANNLTYSVDISIGQDSYNTVVRHAVNYTLSIDLSNAISAGVLPNGSNVVLNIRNLAVLSTLRAGSKNFQFGAVFNLFQEFLNLPQMTDTQFYQYMLDEVQNHPNNGFFGGLVSNIVSLSTESSPHKYAAGHLPLSSTMNNGPLINLFDQTLWQLNGSTLECRFAVCNDDGFSSLVGNVHKTIFGDDWNNINSSSIGSGGAYGTVNSSGFYPSPTPAYATTCTQGIEYNIDGSWHSSESNLVNNYYQSSSTSAIAQGLPNITLETSSLPQNIQQEVMGFKSGSFHNFGIVYYDDANRSSSVQKIKTTNYVPSFVDRPSGIDYNPCGFKIEVLNEAPSWATKWQIVYTGNRNIEKTWQFRCDGVEIIDDNAVLKLEPLSKFLTNSDAEALYYDFVQGDRFKFIEDINGTLAVDNDNFKIIEKATYSGALPFEFNVSLASASSSFAGGGSSILFGAGALVEVYRPKKDVGDDDIFYYEISEVHPIVFDSGSSEYRHHVSNTNSFTNLFDSSGTSGQTVTNANQTAIDTAGSGAIVFLNRGDVYHRLRLTPSHTPLDFIEDFNANDYYKSDNWDAGRPNVINDDFREVRRPSTIFYSEPLIPNTNINGLSSMFPDDSFEEFDKSYGSIQKLHSRENQLIIFQEDKVSRAQVNRDIITTGSGDQILTAQGAIISQAIPYAGEYGICEQPESFAEYAEVLYFVDIKRGAVCRLSQNGITPISEYQMKNYFTDFFRILSRKNLNDSNGRRPALYGCFNPKDKEYMLNLDLLDWHTIFNHGATSTELDKETGESSFFDNFDIRNTFSSNTQGKSMLALKKKSLAKQTIVFSELSNRWTYFMDVYGMCEYINNEVLNFAPSMTSSTTAGSVGGSHDGALLYVLRREEFDSSSFSIDNYGEFYSQETGGTQLNSRNIVKNQAVFVSNVEPSLNKVYNSIGIECNIKPTNFEIQNNYRQYSQIFNSYWKTKENFHYSNIYGDINSFSAFDSGNQYAGMINGERIRSTDAVIRTAWTTDKYLRLHAVNIGLTPSQKSGVV